MKASIKEKKTAVELTIGSLSRKANDGYEMETVSCELVYDTPNVGEVTYLRPGGAVAKVRAMTVSERQEELPFDKDGAGPLVVVPAEQSVANIEEFFDKPGDPSADDLDASLLFGNSVAEEQAVAEATAGALPANFEAEVRQSVGAPEPFPATLKEQIEQAEKKPGYDEIWSDAILMLKNRSKVSAGIFQRELKVSYIQAAHLIDTMQAEGLIDKDGKKLTPKAKSGPKDLKAEHAKQMEEGW